ncbi:MAG: SpoIIE family protein phosphatase, partial [Clostridia bacterium]|nr:SpoIIE family protein phosphatase [Clostridia bacterium]
VIYALRVSQHVLLALRYEPQLTRQRQLERYQEELSQALGLPLHVAQRSKDIILFEETPPLQAECYHLSASAGDVRGANGDAVLMRTALGGLELCMLSDGMGHGEAAHAESEKTLELLSLCIDAGYPLPAALDAINCIMLSSTDGEQYATVDLCAADLWAGTAQLYKLGACPSLLITGASLRTLESSALPLGILPDVRSAAHTFTIGDGDMLLQFTDGLSDACGGLHALEKQVELLMRDRLHASPEAVCTALLSAAMRRAGGVPQDDMTILCTLFKKRQSKKRELPSRDAS